MARKTPIDKLSDSIGKILAEYQEDVAKDTGQLVRSFAKKGAQAIRSSAKGMFGGSGKYAKGWTTQFETGRLSTQGVIYNSAAPGLAHLLENGHAKRGGGRVAGRAHIAPVEEKIADEFYKAVKETV